MSWTWDAPAGVYKDHTLTAKVRREVIADVQFAKFASNEPFGKHKGQSTTITRILALGVASKVGELDKLPSTRPTIQTKTVTVSEWGQKIPWSQFEADLTHYELPAQFEQSLREQMTLTMDKMDADAAKLTPIKYIPKLSGAVIRTDGTLGGNVADKNLDVSDLRTIHDYMRQTLKCPYFRNGKYAGILGTRGARGIKNDPVYEAWQSPTSSDPFMSGALKDVEGFLLFETNHANALADLAGTSVVLGDSVFFGADAFANLEVRAPEIVMSLPLQDDLGRFREIGWLGILDAFLVWETASLSRVVHVTSA